MIHSEMKRKQLVTSYWNGVNSNATIDIGWKESYNICTKVISTV